MLCLISGMTVSGQTINWIKQISGNQYDYIKGMTTDASGNIYVVGGFSGTINFGGSQATAQGSDIWFGKYTSAGALVWAHGIGGGDDDFGMDIALDNSGNVYITGYFNGQSPAPDFDPSSGTANPTVSNGFFIAKYNNSGSFQWLRTIGGTSVSERAFGIAVDGSSNVYVSGTLLASSSTNINFNPGMLYSVKNAKSIIHIPVANYPEGQYYLQVVNKDGVKREQILIKR